MQRLDIDELKPSMVLASTIKDDTGNIIFPKGTQLTERHIGILRNRDIRKVAVEGGPADGAGGMSEELGKEIDSRFSHAGSHPVILRIRDTIKELLA